MNSTMQIASSCASKHILDVPRARRWTEYLGAAHFTDAVHGELGAPHIQGAAAYATGQDGPNGGPTQHVVPNAELLSGNAPLVR